jgi:phage terminase large subunit
VIRFRRGRDGRSIKPVKYKGVDTMELAANVAALIERHNPDAVFVDGGGVGGGVVDRLKQMGYRVIEVQSGEKAHDPDKYLNRRAEMWGEMREWMIYGCIDNEQGLIDDLTGPEYSIHLKGQIKLETKDSMKKRGLASPDDADALALTFAEPIARRDSNILKRRSMFAGRAAQSDYDVFST